MRAHTDTLRAIHSFQRGEGWAKDEPPLVSTGVVPEWTSAGEIADEAYKPRQDKSTDGV